MGETTASASAAREKMQWTWFHRGRRKQKSLVSTTTNASNSCIASFVVLLRRVIGGLSLRAWQRTQRSIVLLAPSWLHRHLLSYSVLQVIIFILCVPAPFNLPGFMPQQPSFYSPYCLACAMMEAQEAHLMLRTKAAPESEMRCADQHVDVCEDAEQRLAKKGRGRPPRGSAAFDLTRWLAVHRPGQYKVLPGIKKPVFCYKCNKRILLQRDSPSYLLLHEKRMHHHQLENHTLRDEGSHPPLQCHGIDTDHAECGFQALRESCDTWFAHGMLSFRPLEGEKDPFGRISCSLQEGKLVIRSKWCLGAGSDTRPCGKCKAACCDKSLQTAL